MPKGERTMILNLEEYMNKSGRGVSEYGARNTVAFNKTETGKLKKDKIEPGTISRKIIPLALEIPFNPFTGEVGEFNSETPYLFEPSVSTSVNLIKQAMRQNEELKAKYAGLAGLSVDEYDISTDEYTEQDKLVFSRFRKILHYNLMVYKYGFSSYGKYGRKGLCKLTFNEFGEPVNTELSYQIYEFEKALAFQQCADIEQEYKTGSKRGKPEQQMKDEKKAVWKRMKVSAPYRLGVIRYMSVKLNADETFSSEVVTDLAGNNLRKFELYAGCNKGDLEAYQAIIGTKYDKHVDYIEVDIMYQAHADVPEEQRKLEAYKTRKVSERIDSDNRVSAVVENFDELYKAFRDNEDIFSEKVIVGSVYDYRVHDDSKIRDAYKADLETYREGILTTAIAEQFQNLIANIDSGLSDSLIDDIMEDKLKEGKEVALLETEHFKDEVKPTDEVEGYGVSATDDEDDLIVDDESLEALMED